jgi:hypothetical protein
MKQARNKAVSIERMIPGIGTAKYSKITGVEMTIAPVIEQTTAMIRIKLNASLRKILASKSVITGYR